MSDVDVVDVEEVTSIAPGLSPNGQVPAVHKAKSHGVAALAPQAVLPTTSFANLAAAISGVMNEIKPVAKEGTNKFQNYRYARMQDVLAELTPLIGKHGLVILQTEVDRGFIDGNAAVQVTYRFTILHKSGEVWPEQMIQTGVSSARTSKGTFDDKAINKCHTAARKYFLLALFQIPTEDMDDNDSEAGGGEVRGGEDQAQSGSRRSRAPNPGEEAKSQVEVDSATGETKPYKIGTQNKKFESWADEFIAGINKASTDDKVTEWIKVNKETLDMMKGAEKAQASYSKIQSAATKRREALLGSSGTKKTEAASDVSKDALDPEEFLKMVEDTLAAITDPDKLEETFNEKIGPYESKVLPTDWEEAVGKYRRHETRLAP